MDTAKILIVEDEGIIAVGLEKLLVSFGYACAGIAFTGEEAVALAQKLKPDLVLMDVRLAGEMDGITAGVEITKTLDVPIIFLTSYSDESTIKRATSTLPFGYLTKPVADRTLRSMIEISLRRSALERKIKTSENTFRSLFELSPAPMLLASSNYTIERANTSALALFQRPLLQDSVDHVFIDLNRSQLKDSLLPIEVKAMRGDGTVFWVSLVNRSIYELESDKQMRLFVVSDITSQKEREVLWRQKAAALTDSNEKLEHFAAIASHDLRAPARTTGLYLSLLKKECTKELSTTGLEYLDLAVAESKKMQELVTDLLEYSHVCHGDSELKPVSLLKVVRDTLSILDPEINKRRADVTFEVMPYIMGSEIQLRRLFINLITNALKFTRRKKALVHISAKEEGRETVVSVIDNGIGISEEEKDSIFGVFQRGDSQSEFVGTGVGLASCYQIMKNHYGRIWVESEPGRGSIFYLAFPRLVEGPAFPPEPRLLEEARPH